MTVTGGEIHNKKNRSFYLVLHRQYYKNIFKNIEEIKGWPQSYKSKHHYLNFFRHLPSTTWLSDIFTHKLLSKLIFSIAPGFWRIRLNSINSLPKLAPPIRSCAKITLSTDLGLITSRRVQGITCTTQGF